MLGVVAVGGAESGGPPLCAGADDENFLPPNFNVAST